MRFQDYERIAAAALAKLRVDQRTGEDDCVVVVPLNGDKPREYVTFAFVRTGDGWQLREVVHHHPRGQPACVVRGRDTWATVRGIDCCAKWTSTDVWHDTTVRIIYKRDPQGKWVECSRHVAVSDEVEL